MSTRFYDNALIEKLKTWTRNTQVTVTKLNDFKRMIEVVADKSSDAPVKLPLIVLSRSAGFTIEKPQKTALSCNGMRLEANSSKTATLNAIPISIPYQLDIYTRYQEEADEYIRNLVFNIINYPKLLINIPYHSKNYEHVASIHMNTEVEDNSDIPERLIAGQFTRMTITFNVDDAYLFDVRVKDTLAVSPDSDVTCIKDV